MNSTPALNETEPNESEEWDAVVIGAGPAGAVVATRLADAGKRVLLVEAKRFPRQKTCGGCLNARAVAGLEDAGLGDALRSCGAAAVDRVRLHHRGRVVQTPLPEGRAVTRWTLDAVLADAAQRRGVVFRTGVRARVLPESAAGWRAVSLVEEGGRSVVVRTRLVVACDGLGHPSLTGVPGFAPVVSRLSRVGIGTVLEGRDLAGRYPRGVITMAIDDRGYVGLAVCERERLNLAAAFDARALRGGDPRVEVNRVLAGCGLPALPAVDRLAWRGSPRLSQRTPRVAGERLLLVGDAAGYVEPFTGEGMGAAIEGANAAAPIALRAMEGWSGALADEWQTVYTRGVRRQQSVCRALAWMLQRPLAVRVGLGLASLAPVVGRAVAARVGAERRETPKPPGTARTP